ncbi:MAG: cysteine protease StiP domain-containing protein, partial [Pseudomonadota bacterium]
HYSEMISEERRPDPRYMALFEDALDRHDARIAAEIMAIALRLRADIAEGTRLAALTLCSLVRAGLPYGVLLHRALSQLGVDSAHFGVSIIRDRGLDENAMAHVRAARPASSILFVDGWTGKGAIAGELARSWPGAELVVLADPSGHASLSGSHEDWLIPSGLLGANASGLVSRSILNADVVGPGDFHGAIPVPHLADLDVSRRFVDRITDLFAETMAGAVPAVRDPAQTARLRADAAACIDAIAERLNITNRNRIKPGIAEATRAVLRRRPRLVLLRDDTDPDLAALVHLCRTDGIETDVSAAATGPYRAITVIHKVRA